jgi:monofunctional biosynthetic peptidoglycan transglycosylase
MIMENLSTKPLSGTELFKCFCLSIIQLIGTAAFYFFITSIALVLLYRFIPVPFTPHMISRKIEARAEGSTLHILHQWVPIEKISPHLQRSVIEAEDAHFYEHRGFDFDAITYAQEQNERYGMIVSGGSTISQQTAKNIFCTHARTYTRKAFEAYFTILIELLWGKERILEVYLNMIEMGDGVFGAEAAAQSYFHCSAEQLNQYQAAQIALSLPAPRLYMGKP